MNKTVITRELPDSNISRQKASNTMVKKNNSIVAPEKSALTPNTIERLNKDDTAYNTAISAVIKAKANRNAAKNTVEIKRDLIRKNISGIYNTVNKSINLGTMNVEARAFYGLSTGNKQSPNVNSDIKIEFWGQKIIEGDAARVAEGGIAMSNPTIIQFTTIYAAFQTAITGFSTTKTAVGKAEAAVNNLNDEMDLMLLRATNEVETTYSELDAPAKRAAAREWGVRYMSVGSGLVISGTIIDKKTNLPLGNVKVHLGKGRNKVVADDTGKFSLTTTLFGDLELIAEKLLYDENITSIKLENGVNMTVNLSMEEA